MCGYLGIEHPDYLTMTAYQLRDWQRFYAQHGFGDDRHDIQWGMFMSMYANCHRKENVSPYEVKDFMPYHDKYAEQMTIADMKKRINKIFGG